MAESERQARKGTSALMPQHYSYGLIGRTIVRHWGTDGESVSDAIECSTNEFSILCVLCHISDQIDELIEQTPEKKKATEEIIRVNKASQELRANLNKLKPPTRCRDTLYWIFWQRVKEKIWKGEPFEWDFTLPETIGVKPGTKMKLAYEEWRMNR